MAFDSYLAERIDRILDDSKVSYQSKKMMGGLCYMVDENVHRNSERSLNVSYRYRCV